MAGHIRLIPAPHPMAFKVTLDDVARQAGVHRSTVSLALRGHPRISAPVRQRICTLAAKLGYRVNPLVAALMKSRRTGHEPTHATIAFVTNHSTRDGWRPAHCDRPDFFPGAVNRAGELGYNLEHFWMAEPRMTPKRFSSILMARGIHGLIVGRLPPGLNSLELEWDQFSCVAVGMTLKSPFLHHVTENHFDTAWQAMQQCLDRGYRRIGFVFSDANDSPRVGDRWLAAYLLKQQECAPEDRPSPCPSVPADFDTFRNWFVQEKPDAIIATHGCYVHKWLESMGVKVPDEVGIVDLEARTPHSFAGVYYDSGKVGSLAVETLVGLMYRNETGVPVDQHEILLTGEWRDGWSLPPRNR